MKNIRFVLSVSLLISMLFFFSACSQETASEPEITTESEYSAAVENLEPSDYKDGVYTSSATGKKGKVEVIVTIENGAISQIEIGENQETPRFMKKVSAQLPDEIIQAQSVNVDTVTGATATSNAVLRAVQDCLKEAE